MFYEFTVGDKTYKLRLTTRDIVSLEKKLGCNPIAIFGNGDTIPTVTTMVQVLHASLQTYNHGIDANGAYDIFDSYIADGHSVTDFIAVIVEIYKASGIINKEALGEGSEKN